LKVRQQQEEEQGKTHNQQVMSNIES